MINVNKLKDLGFTVNGNGPTTKYSFGEIIYTTNDSILPMTYVVDEFEQNGQLITGCSFYLYGFRLETVPNIEQIAEFVELYNVGVL